jgi:hypothetical protein
MSLPRYQLYIDGSFVDALLDYTRSKAVWIRTADDPIPDPFIMR